MPKITEMYCFAISDSGEDEEGVAAFYTIAGVMPMVGADMERVEDLIPLAQRIADLTGKEIRIYHFSQRKQINVIRPNTVPETKDEIPSFGSRLKLPD